MTGSTTRISKLGYGEIEQFLRDLTEEGFGGHHIRDFKDDKPAFRQWVQDGIALIEGRWATLPIHTPGKAWTQIEGTIVWTCQRDADSKFTEEDGTETLEIWISTVPEPGLLRDGQLVYLHPRKWKSVHGVLMRRAGHNDIEVRVPAQHVKQTVVNGSDEWGAERRFQLSVGVLMSISRNIEASLWNRHRKQHDCLLCDGAHAVIKLTSTRAYGPQAIALHFRDDGWVTLDDNVQIRRDPSAINAIWVRNRK